MSGELIGFIGLGHMGGPMAAHIAEAGYEMVVFDIAGTEERSPKNATCVNAVGEVAESTEVIFLSLPNVAVGKVVADQIANSKIRAGALVIDTGTIGPKTAKEIHAQLEQKHIGYVDCPVSGMVLRAREGTLASMYSGSKSNLERIHPMVSSYSANVYHVGTEPGQGQLMKLVNNYLGISHFVTTSEAITCGLKGGLKIETMLDVIEAASGQNFVASHIFPRYMVSETYDSGGPATLPHKDLALYVDAAKEMGTPHHVSSAALEILKAFVEHDPEADQSTIYRFIKDNN